MVQFLFTTVVMFVFWFSLSGETVPLLLILGVLSSMLVAYWSADLLFEEGKKPDLGMLLRFIAYLPYLMWQTILSNLHIFFLILNPKMPLEPGVIKYKHNLQSDLGIVIFANSITLTPGTLTIGANREELLVHHINRKVADDLMTGEMEQKVKEIEGEKELQSPNA